MHPLNGFVRGLALLLTLAGGLAWASDPVVPACIPPLSYLPLDPASVGADDNGLPALGSYERISPDGRFVLRSYSGSRLGEVSLVELPLSGSQLRAWSTPLSNEAFPVQGSWRYLVDVNGDHYRFSEVLLQGRRARPLFRAGMAGFYAVAAEMPTPSADVLPPDFQLRSLSWPQRTEPDGRDSGPLQAETLQLHDDGQRAQVQASSGKTFICGHRRGTDGGAFALPMLSVDGTEFSAIPQSPQQGQPTMRIYSLAQAPQAREHPCALRADLGLAASKAVFGFAHGPAPAWLVYSDIGSVYLHDRQLQHTFRLDRSMRHVLASAFPGLTRDGRVIYGATWHACGDKQACPQQAGYVVVDPYQSVEYRAYWNARGEPPPKTCITQQEVRRQRQRFAGWHGLSGHGD